jgi:hypothetical protein
MSFLKEGEICRRKKCSEHLKELDRNVGETEVDQTDANPGTVEIVYARICIEGEIKVRNIKISSKLCFHIYAFLFKQTLFDIQMNAFPVPI